MIDNSFDSEKHYRQKNHSIKPHYIPIIGEHIAAEGIKNTEGNSGEILTLNRVLYIISKS